MYVQIALQARQTTLMDEPTHPQQVAPMVAATVDEGIRLLGTKTVADFPEKHQVTETAHVLRWIHTLVDWGSMGHIPSITDWLSNPNWQDWTFFYQ